MAPPEEPTSTQLLQLHNVVQSKKSFAVLFSQKEARKIKV